MPLMGMIIRSHGFLPWSFSDLWGLVLGVVCTAEIIKSREEHRCAEILAESFA